MPLLDGMGLGLLGLQCSGIQMTSVVSASRTLCPSGALDLEDLTFRHAQVVGGFSLKETLQPPKDSKVDRMKTTISRNYVDRVCISQVSRYNIGRC